MTIGYIRTTSGFCPYCLIPILVPIICPVHTIAVLVIQFMLIIVELRTSTLQQHWLSSLCSPQCNYAFIIVFTQHSPAIPYHAVYSYTYAHVPRLFIQFDYILYRTMQTLHAYVFRPLVLHIYTGQHLGLTFDIYKYPSHYSSGLFYDNLY